MNAQPDQPLADARKVRTLRVADVVISRSHSDRFDLPPGPLLPMSDGVSVIVQVQDFAAHTLWRNGQVVHAGGHPRAALAITDLQAAWRCHHRAPFDNVRFHFPRSAIEAFVAEGGGASLRGLRDPAGDVDRVAWALAVALLPALDDPSSASRLFVDHVLLALQTHLAHHYGGAPGVDGGGRLARWQEDRATELLSASLQGDLSLAEVATACGLSRSHFGKAFKQSTGRTPHRWLQEYRIATAQRLLSGSMPVVQVAAACGFADQSHLTRVFTRMVGVPPSKWRRLRR